LFQDPDSKISAKNNKWFQKLCSTIQKEDKISMIRLTSSFAMPVGFEEKNG
jgi:hypothetical protein